MDIQFLVMGLGASVAAFVGGGWWFLWRFSQARHLLDTPTSKIRSAAQGYVEFYGVLHASGDNQLNAPLTNTACLWWRYKIEQQYLSSEDERSWRTLESRTSEAWLCLEDGTGICMIDPRGAQVRPLTRKVWRSAVRHPLGLDNSGWSGLLSSGNDYRYTEERLHAGQPLYAIGDFRSRGGGRQGLELAASQEAVIREWKGDFAGLLQRFDSDGNGQLDEREWQRVQLAASLEAQDRHRRQSTQPVQHHLAGPREAQPFILSCAGEDELVRQFYWQAAGGALLCLAGALAAAWLLGINHF
jgi:hypothetical protein